MKNISLPERMLDAYLGLSSRLWNRRIPSFMSFNEAVVCHHLEWPRQAGSPQVTATDLCTQTKIAKSQMNRILTKLEERGLVRRVRSEEDRREVLLELTDGEGLFRREHGRNVAMVARMQSYFGIEKSLELTVLVEEFVEMLKTTDALEQGK